MRLNLAVLSAVVYVMFLVVPSAWNDALAKEEATAPHIGDVCNVLGTTTLSDDQMDIAACLKTDEVNKNGKTILRWKGTARPQNCKATIDKCLAAMQAKRLTSPYVTKYTKIAGGRVPVLSFVLPPECYLKAEAGYPTDGYAEVKALQYFDAVNMNCGFLTQQASFPDCSTFASDDVRGSIVCTADDKLTCTQNVPAYRFIPDMQNCGAGGK